MNLYDRVGLTIVTPAGLGMAVALEMGWPLWISAAALGVPALVLGVEYVHRCEHGREGGK